MAELLRWEAELCGWVEKTFPESPRQDGWYRDATNDAQPDMPTHADLRPELLRFAAEAGRKAGLPWVTNGRRGHPPATIQDRVRFINPLTSTDDALTLARAVGLQKCFLVLMPRIVDAEWDWSKEDPDRWSAPEIFGCFVLDAEDNATIARAITAAAIEAAGVTR